MKLDRVFRGLFIGIAVGAPLASSAQSVQPTSPPATHLEAGSYDYLTVVHGVADSYARVVVTADTSATVVETKVTLAYGNGDVYYHSIFRFGADGLPVLFGGEQHPDRGRTDVAAARWSSDGVDFPLRHRSARLGNGATSWAVIDGLNFAGTFALPIQLALRPPGSWSVAAPFGATVSNATCTPLAAAPAKEVPRTDAGLSCDGRHDATIWYDPTTLVPDKIESEGIVFFRILPKR